MTRLPQDCSRVALYCRVSTPQQVQEGYGLDYQESQLTEHAAAVGYRVVETIREPGVSRTEFNWRGLDSIRELARTGQIDAVLAWKRDRYFGDPGMHSMFQSEMDAYGVRLLALDDSGTSTVVAVQEL